jgi:glycosyltransferase involved in cell wall biosynthesis
MGDTVSRPRICFVVASEMTVKAFLLDHLRALSKRFDVSVAVDTANPTLLEREGLAVGLFPVRIRRPISPTRDLFALAELLRLFRRERFDAVHSVTPKAGLLSMSAAAVAGVPHRTHTFTGQIWATRTGIVRQFLKRMDSITAALTTTTLADSRSQLDFLIAEGVVKPEKSTVLASGSISGVDVTRFRPDLSSRAEIRKGLGLSGNDVLFLHLGRLNRDKGVLDLAEAFARIATDQENTWLLFVGPDEGDLEPLIKKLTDNVADRVHFVGFTREPERYMAASDVLCVPSYREGFGSVVIEAAAVGIPALASRIYGLVDAIEEGYSGLFNEPRDIASLAEQMTLMAANHNFRQLLGKQALERAHRLFRSDIVVGAMVRYYEELLGDDVGVGGGDGTYP